MTAPTLITTVGRALLDHGGQFLVVVGCVVEFVELSGKGRAL
jgi:hypothetical protein